LEQCREAVRTHLTQLFKKFGGIGGAPWGEDPQPVLLWIVRCALVLAKMRQENPHRAQTVLTNLARGHALVHGRQVITQADLPVIAHVTVSSMPPEYGQIFTRLVGARDLTVAQVGQILGSHRNTARTVMRAVGSLGIVKFKEAGPGKTGLLRFEDSFSWCNSTDFQEILSAC
jgi:hypothetical protein